MTKIFTPDLVSPSVIRRYSDDFIKKKRIGLETVSRRLPSAAVLFDLAAEVSTTAPTPGLIQVGARLRAARQMAGQSAGSLAVVIGHASTQSAEVMFSKIESGGRALPAASAAKLAKSFRVPLDWLWLGGRVVDDIDDLMPDWLWPYHGAIVEARGVLSQIDPRGFTSTDSAYGAAMEVVRNDTDARPYTPETWREAIQAAVRAVMVAAGTTDPWIRLAHGKGIA